MFVYVFCLIQFSQHSQIFRFMFYISNLLTAHIDFPKLKSVSYTHLDVYKRQVCVWSKISNSGKCYYYTDSKNQVNAFKSDRRSWIKIRYTQLECSCSHKVLYNQSLSLGYRHQWVAPSMGLNCRKFTLVNFLLLNSNKFHFLKRWKL